MVGGELFRGGGLALPGRFFGVVFQGESFQYGAFFRGGGLALPGSFLGGGRFLGRELFRGAFFGGLFLGALFSGRRSRTHPAHASQYFIVQSQEGASKN